MAPIGAGEVCDGTRRLLLLGRAAERHYKAGSWDLPGGKVEAGEPFDVTVRREVEEETSISAIPNRTAGTSDNEVPHVCVTNLLLEVSVSGGIVRRSPESSEAKWCQSEKVAGRAPDCSATVQVSSGSNVSAFVQFGHFDIS